MASGTCMSYWRLVYFAPCSVQDPMVAARRVRQRAEGSRAWIGGTRQSVAVIPVPDLALEVFGTGSWSTSEVDLAQLVMTVSFLA